MSTVDEIEAEIAQKTVGRRFIYPDGERGVDARGWAEEAVRLGFGADWALDWIDGGQPQPMEWIRRLNALAVRAGEARRRLRARGKPTRLNR